MAGPHITLTRPPILSDPKSGMRRSGMPGINATRTTGRLLNKGTPIGVDIALVSVMTRIFITNTIAGQGEGWNKGVPSGVRPRRPPAHTFVPRNPPARVCSRISPPVPAPVRLSPQVLACVRHNQPIVLAIPRRPPAPISVLTSPPVRACVRLSPPVPESVRLNQLARASVRFSPPVL